MAMVATDGHRLAHLEKSGESFSGIQRRKENPDPWKLCRNCNRCSPTPKTNPLDFADDDAPLFFRLGHRMLDHP